MIVRKRCCSVWKRRN